MLDEEGNNVSTPKGFLSPVSSNTLFQILIIPEKNKVTLSDDVDREGCGNKDDDFNKRCKAVIRESPKETAIGSTSCMQQNGKRFKSTGRNHAIESTCLDLMDKEEELEKVLHFYLQTYFYIIFGLPDTATVKAGNSPPSQIYM